jgi:FtsP/CotA-like multicopper oxidase with cupredoxin domain
MARQKRYPIGWFLIGMGLAAAIAQAQTFRVECPTTTTLHPNQVTVEPPYTGPASRVTSVNGNLVTYVDNGGAIKCQHISGGDGYATMADGTQTYLFAFSPLSGMNAIQHGLPGTMFPSVFNSSYPGNLDGAVADPANMMNIGVLNGNLPAPMMAIDEDDEFFLTLSNVGMIMRPDLFEQHTVHFHGYPNASPFFDGVPDASAAINIAGSFSYYYLAPDAGTYFWHCHITPPEHLQMGMVGQLYVRPRQNRVPGGASLYQSLLLQQSDLRTACPNTGPNAVGIARDILCATPLPPSNPVTQVTGNMYAYNDGDGSTRYDVEMPIQIHGFDPNFHFVGMTFNPEGFSDMKDKYFLLNGRSYPDTVNTTGNYPGALQVSASDLPASPSFYTLDSDGASRPSQPLTSTRTVKVGQKILLRISNLDVTEYQTLASQIPMTVIALNARLLRDQAGNNLYYKTNSITLGGGESLDVILDTTGMTAGTYFLYTPQLDHLSNDAENFGGLMTEIVVTL